MSLIVKTNFETKNMKLRLYLMVFKVSQFQFLFYDCKDKTIFNPNSLLRENYQVITNNQIIIVVCC